MLRAIERRARIGLAHLAAAAPAVLADAGAAERWWNALSPEQMVAALHGGQATEAQAMAAKKMYADLDGETRDFADAATAEIYNAAAHRAGLREARP
ncbi:MAG: hypothetical protein OXQ29_10610 [Rhodospirillaceae bacterium]|nr:hypothetical protein [Rhodospirillaceae bacterium]